MQILWENIAPKLGTWADKFKPFWESGGFDRIYSKLKEEGRRGKKIAPLSSLTYRALTETPISEIKVILMGLCPYHTERNGAMIADGLLMSCGEHEGYIPPSLDQFYRALEIELKDGLCLPCVKTSDLSYLARQGVLMWNYALTTEIGKAGNHLEIWDEFQKFFFEEIVSVLGIPVVTLGKEAAKIKKWLGPMQWFFPISHPAAASRQGEQWDSKGTFTKVNRILKDMNNEQIEWLLTEAPF